MRIEKRKREKRKNIQHNTPEIVRVSYLWKRNKFSDCESCVQDLILDNPNQGALSSVALLPSANLNTKR